MGYALLQWFSGNSPSKGNKITGDFESFGFKDLYNITSDAETRVWVDNYFMDKDSVIERFYEKCS